VINKRCANLKVIYEDQIMWRRQNEMCDSEIIISVVTDITYKIAIYFNPSDPFKSDIKASFEMLMSRRLKM
jgi:hypothetical protein